MAAGTAEPCPIPGSLSDIEPFPKVIVEAWPSGGWVVRIAGHPVPVSRHDTEEEALDRATAYRQGFTNELLRGVRDGHAGSSGAGDT